MKRILLSWSGGKDCAWALHRLRAEPGIEVAGLVTTFNEAFDRVAMHAVRSELIRAQAAACGLPLWPVPLPWPCDNAQYEDRMRALCQRARAQNIAAVAFGDLFLEDVRAYRERQMAAAGLEPLFPVWGLPTAALAQEMIASGLCATLTCIDTRHLPPTFGGRSFDRQLLADLPTGVDPCGERGEFHTFVSAGPMFSQPVLVARGDQRRDDPFLFTDLLPQDSLSPVP